MNYPEMCYVYVESGMEVGIVKWGESGYYRTEYAHNTSNEELVKELNSKLEVSENEAEAMKILSMNQSIDGNTTEWEKKYTEILNRMDERAKTNECRETV